MFVLRIHEFECGKCDCLVKLLCFVRLCENRPKEENYDFEWINEVVVLS
jgi:hypothetical protein